MASRISSQEQSEYTRLQFMNLNNKNVQNVGKYLKWNQEKCQIVSYITSIAKEQCVILCRTPV